MGVSLGEYLKRNYRKPGHPAFFLGLEKLRNHLHQKGYTPTKSFLKQWLNDQEAYSLHKDARRRFPTIKVITPGPNHLIDTDLADLSDLADSNDSVRYLLITIDGFSKVARVKPLKSKTAAEVSNAMRDIISQMETPPKIIRHDPGKEYTNSKMKYLLKEHGITDQTTTNQGKAHFAERFIRTLKGLVYRYITDRNNLRYIDVLQDIVRGYNETRHSSTGLKPNDVNGDVAKRLFWKMHKPSKLLKPKPFTFSIGDTVRLSYTTNPFTRSFDQHWTGEIFFIRERYRRQGIPLYKIKDYNGEDITGTFYTQELQKVTLDANKIWKVEKVLKTRKRKGKVESLVRWLHWPEKFDSWVEDLQQL